MSFGVCSYMLRIAADVVALKASVEKFLISYVFTQHQQTPKAEILCRRNQTSLQNVYLYFKFKKSEQNSKCKNFLMTFNYCLSSIQLFSLQYVIGVVFPLYSKVLINLRTSMNAAPRFFFSIELFLSLIIACKS